MLINDLIDKITIELNPPEEDDENRVDLFHDDDPVHWILENFYIPETDDHRIILVPYQIACLDEALARDENGMFLYSTILWGDIKKSIKSTISAAVALWMAFTTPWASVKIVANDLKQADSRAAFYARRCIELNPAMKDICKVKPSGYLIELPNKSKIEAIPVDPKGEAGGNDDAVIYSELWAANNRAAQRLWTETTLSPMKFGRSFRWVETYAGFSGESPLLETLYENGTKQGRRIDLSYEDIETGESYNLSDLNVYENRAARLFCLWNQVPRLPWQTEEYYAQEASTLTDDEFRRVHRNEWSSSLNKFVPLEWWLQCQAELPPLDKNTPVVIGMDAATSDDCFGVVMVSGLGDGENYALRYSRKWQAGKGSKIDFQGNDDNPGPEMEVRRLLKEYNVVEIAYDPYQLHDMAGRLSNELIAHMYEFSQGQERLIGDKQLYDMIKARRILHSGDPDVEDHIKNANKKEEGDSKLRIVKRSQLLKIDLVVALSMALSRAKYWRL